LIAAGVITTANHDFSQVTLSAYAEQMKSRFGMAMPMNQLSWLPVAWLRRIAATLMATRWFARHTVVEDWFLRANEQGVSERSPI